MNRDDLIAALKSSAQRPPLAVEVDGWGTLYVKPPTVAEVDASRQQEEPEGDGKQFARGACRVLCDEAGNRIFDATNAEHVDLLNLQDWAKLQKVIAAASGRGTDTSGN